MTDWFSLLHKSTIFYFPFTICHVNSCCTNCDILYDLEFLVKKMLIGIVGSLLVHETCRVATNVMGPLIERMTNDNEFGVMRVC